MKKVFFFLLFLLPLSSFAQEFDDILFQLENNPPPFSPFTIAGSYLNVARTHFRTPGVKDDTLKYAQWEAALAYKHPLTEACGLIFGAGWVGAEVDRANNPDFDETNFNYVNLAIGGYTASFPDWLWTLTIAGFFDTDEFSFVDYALYQGVLWGRYALNPCIELDVGLIVEVGLRKDKVWPLIGFVYTISDRWYISVIYPVDISFNYLIFDCLTATVSTRFLRNRHRVRESEPNSQGIFEYRTTGVEFDLTYSPSTWFSVLGFAGRTFNGNFKISDRNDKNAIYYKFNGAFYAGVQAAVNF